MRFSSLLTWKKIVYVSPAYERISGMSCQSLLDNPHALVELVHPVDRKRMRTSFPQSFRNVNEATNEEFRIIRLDGEMRWLWLQSYPVKDEANNSPLKATSIVDITDRKKIENKLRERETNPDRAFVGGAGAAGFPTPSFCWRQGAC